MRAAQRPLMLSLFLLALSACSPDAGQDHAGPSTVASDTLLFDHSTVLGMLRLSNDAASDLTFLMDAVGVANAPADAIVRHRQGDDRVDGTWDDDPFDDGFELSDLVDVDADALHALTTAAHALDLCPDLVLEGVDPTDLQASLTARSEHLGLRLDRTSGV